MTDNSLYTVIPYKNKLLQFTKPTRAFLYYKNKSVNLITGEESCAPIEKWIDSLTFKLIDHVESKRFIHLMYECGYLFENLENLVNEQDLLAIDVTYAEMSDYDLKSNNRKIKLKALKYPEFSEYEKKFNLGYDELKKGNCYQFNLTEDFLYQFDPSHDACDFISKIWKENDKRGAYGSATYIGNFKRLFLSNSPECLFQYEKGELLTRPVKGTLRRKTSSLKEVKTLWREITSDQKSQAELYMITDLLRNDLSRIDLPKAVVTKMKAPLLAPGIIHQYSEIKINLRSHVTLKDVVIKMFPGGSITGAPKNKVMNILKLLENRNRGFYCGSTVMLNSGLAMASINIRSGVFDFTENTYSYQAGGGITLLSSAKSEYDELLLKLDSFLTLLTL